MRRILNVPCVVFLLISVSLCMASCGGGGSSESVVPGRLTLSNNCTNTTFDVSGNGSSWGILAPGQSVSNEVAPGFYDARACITNTTTCGTDSTAVSSRESLTVYTCNL